MSSVNYPTQASEFVALRSYCRWLPEEERRETWEEVTDRVLSFLRIETPNGDRIPQKVWTNIKKGMLNFQVMPSMRLVATAGPAAKKNNICIYNCSYLPIDSLKSYSELMLVLMCGVGAGYSVEREYIRKLPIIKHQDGTRRDDYIIEDSREGWAKAFLFGLETWFAGEEVIFNYDNIRPYGTPLKTMGGRSSGKEVLVELLEFTKDLIINAADRKLTSLEAHDIACKTAEVVVAGGTRRSSCISFSDIDDIYMMDAKKGNYPVYRRMSNNSAVYKEKPDTVVFLKEWSSLAEGGTGERGIANFSNLDQITDTRKFNKDMRLNPCFTGDTLIAMADGRGAVPIIDLVKDRKDIPVYSVNPITHKVEIKLGKNPRLTGTNKDIIRIVLDDDTSIKVTPNHSMLLRDGTKIEAKNLKVGDSLCRLTKRLEHMGSGDYLRVNCNTYDASKDKTFEHRLIAKYDNPNEWNILYNENKKNGWIEGGLVIHHKDHVKTNNSPDNLIIMLFKEHCKLHSSIDTIGDKNGRYSGFSNSDIKKHSITLTNILKRRFSTAEWHKYAKERGIPITFSQWRKTGFFHSIYELSVWAANKCGFISNIDPRTLRVHNAALESGYECKVVLNKVMVYNICEECNSKFLVPYNRREQSFCSRKCSSKYLCDPAVLLSGQNSKQLITKNNQIDIFNSLKLNLGRDPYKREWEQECSINNVSHRIQAKSQKCALASNHVFFSYKELKESAIEYNHKVKKIEYLSNRESVYNITVDDNHTVGIVTSFNKTTKECSGIFTFQCGEIVLRPQGCCNLSEAVVRSEDDISDLVEKVKTAAWLGVVQSTLTYFPGLRDKWRKNAEEERLIGVSLTGQLDNPDILTKQVLKQLKKVVIKTAKHASKILDINVPAAFTCVKPSGCRPIHALTTTNKGILTLDEIIGDVQDDSRWINIKRDINANQGTKDNKITKGYINGAAKVSTIRLSYNMEITSTFNHKWYIKQRYIPSQRKYIDINRWVKTIDINDNDILDLNIGCYNNIEPYVFKKYYFKVSNGGNNITQPPIMTNDIAWFLGYLWGDGSQSKTKYRTRFIDQNKYNLYKVQRIFNNVFNIRSNIKEASGNRDAYVLEIGSHELWEWYRINNIWKKNEDELSLIPYCIRSSSYHHIIAFIAGLIDADGCVSVRDDREQIIVATAYDKFASHLQQVCWSVGVGIGRSLNSRGKNKQKNKHIWLMTTNNYTTKEAALVLMNNSTKIKHNSNGNLFNNDKGKLILGKVCDIKISDKMVDTFDIEVNNKHWYYDGCIKSHNTVSQVVNSSSGCHPRFSKYYIRRYRISKVDPLFNLLKDQGVPYHPEVGQTKDNATTMVVSFPVKSPDTCVTKVEWDCMKQLEWYLRVQKNWSTHNVSNTVYVKKNEWLKVGNWVYEHFDDIVGITFVPADDHVYKLAPYESIDESTYEELISKFPKLDFSKLSEYEKITGDTTEAAKTLACGGKESCEL